MEVSLNQNTVISGNERKVLRNTFLLLALTLLPTILGVVLGIEMGFETYAAEHPILTFLGLLAVLIGLIVAILACINSWVGIPLLLVFTAACGVLLSLAIGRVLGTENGAYIVMQTSGATALVVFLCGVFALRTKRDFRSWSGPLLAILLGLLGLVVLNVFLNLPLLTTFISAATFILFSLYLIHDVNKIVRGGETNYVRATLSLYLDILNIYSSLLDLFSGD